MIIERTSTEKTENGIRYANLALWIALVALSYPFFLFLLSRAWYGLASKDLSEGVQAWLTLLIFPVILSCALAFILSLRGRGWRRPTAIICSLVAAVLNLLAFIAIGISY